jgi:hypothetical protein
MATINELNLLVEQLNEVLPPPSKLAGIVNTIPGSGRWVLAKVGSGAYAVRAEFTTISGDTVIAKQQTEIVGFPKTVAMSLRFTINTATAGKHYWIQV